MSGAPYSGSALRRSALHFLGGKAISGVLTLILVLWVVRLLPVADYGAYIALLASLELGIPVAAIGLYWKAAQFLPEFRLHATGSGLQALAHRLLFWQSVSLSVCVLFAWAFIDILLAWTRLSAHRQVAYLFLVLLLVEGLGRFVREAVLGPLLQQGIAQASLVLRVLVHLALIAVWVATDSVSLRNVVLAELAGAITATAVALWGLQRTLAHLRTLPGSKGWSEPPSPDMWRTAKHMYAAHLMTLLYSPQAFTVLLQRQLGAEATALFGFLRTLHDQLARYLPATLLFSIVRPKLVASYLGGGGIQQLASNANLAGKLSLFALVPVIAIVGLSGETLITMASGEKFPSTGWLFFGFMVVLLPFSQRQLLETVGVAAGQSGLCMAAAASGVLMLPLMLLLLALDAGLWATISALGAGHLLFNAIILFGMARKTGYRADTVGATKLAGAGLAGYLAAALVPSTKDSLVLLLAQAVVTLVAFLFVAWMLKPFSANERARLNRSLKRQLFVW